MKNKNRENSAETIAVSPEISEDLPQKKFPWKIFNVLVVIFIFMGGCFLFISALGLTVPMIITDIVLNIFLVFFYQIWLKKRKFRKTVIALRVTAILALVITLAIPLSLINFTYDKPMYQVKKFVYCHGIYNGYMDKFLPTKLPKMCEDYKFITQGSFIAQDYHPSAYLIFRTDTATMHELEEDYKQIDGAEFVNINNVPDIEEYKREYGDNYMEYMPEFPKEFPGHVYYRLDDEHIDYFFDAVIYKVPSYYDKGCVFDYSSGLVVYWT